MCMIIFGCTGLTLSLNEAVVHGEVNGGIQKSIGPSKKSVFFKVYRFLSIFFRFARFSFFGVFLNAKSRTEL